MTAPTTASAAQLGSAPRRCRLPAPSEISTAASAADVTADASLAIDIDSVRNARAICARAAVAGVISGPTDSDVSACTSSAPRPAMYSSRFAGYVV